MKKLFALLLALMMVLSLAACGGGDDEKTPSSDDKTPNSTQQQEQNNDEILSRDETIGDVGEIDRSTVSSFFAGYGLTEENIKPSGVEEGELEVNEYIESQAKVTYKTELDLAKAIEWRDMLMSATKEASDDGKIYANVSSDKEYPTPDWQETAMMSSTATWSYKYNGEVAIVTIDTFYGDFDEPYFSITLELV